MATISTSGIESGRIIRSAHVLRIIEALDGSETNDILISGSLITTGSVGVTGSVDVIGNITGSAFTGSFAGDGSNLTGVTGEWDGTHNGNADITGSFNVSGSTGLTGSLTVSGSVVLSGSYSGSFQGDGSNLSGITGEWDGTRDGNADITGSFNVSGSTGLTGSLDVSGSITGSNDIKVVGGIVSGISGSVIPFYFANQAAFPSAATYHGAIAHSHADGAMYFAHGGAWNQIQNSSGPFSGSFSGSFQGDGTNLTGITAEWDGSHNGKADITGSFNVSGSTGLTGSLDIAKEDPAAIALKVSGSVIVSGSNSNFMRLTVPVQIDNPISTIKAATVSGSMSGSFQGDGSNLTGLPLQNSGSFSGSFQGDGSNLTGITGEWDGSRDGNAQITGSFEVSGSSTLSGSLNVSGSVTATNFSGSMSGSFQGDGSALTGITGEWDGTRDGNAEITGSFNVLGGTGLTGSLFISGSTNTSGSVSISGSLSAGRNNDTISGSIALGTGNNLTGSDAIAIGTNNHASESADGAIMIGVLNDADANANDSIAIGRNNNMGSGGIAMGFYNEVKLGSNRVLVGNHLTSSNSGNDPYLLIGQYNEVSGVEDGFFAIGGGTSTSNRKNALVISSSADHTVHKFEDVIQLIQIHPLPTNVPTGSIATSGSAGSVKPFFWDGTDWNALY